MNGFTSNILHSKDKRQDSNKALRFPIYECAAFEFETAEEIAFSFDGTKPAHAYSRASNPTVEALEQRLIAISGGRNCIAFSSGMAAITNLVLTLCESGSNIVASRYLFGNTVSLFEKTLGPWGLEIKWIDPNDFDEIDSQIDDKTRMVFVETISNPHIVVVDVNKIADLCKSKRIPFVLDNSLATSYLLRSIDYGVSIEIVSTAKYISGGGTAIGGVIIDNNNYDWSLSPKLQKDSIKWGIDTFAKTIRSSVARNTGACLSPHSAYFHMLGLETLSLRIDKSSKNAIEVAEFLNNHSKISKVNYPGLSKSEYSLITKKQFRNGYCGGLLSFELAPKIPAKKFINALNLVKRSSNFNDNKSLIIHPKSTLFCEYSKEKLFEMGIHEQLVRLSVGIEEIEDIISDINQALDGID
jgi:O-acetylhomoserine (thiol)-lyase